MTVTLIGHPSCALHDMGDGHPECPARLHAINDQLIASGLDFVIPQRDAKKVALEHLYRVHDRAYVDSLIARSPTSGHIWLDEDTLMMPHSLDAALHAAGAAIDAVDLALSGPDQQVFCAIRPPGHHATRSAAMGFCFFNNVAAAAAYALEVCGLQRLAIVDFDVHHGNGTEDIVAGDQRILFCSSFQHPLYPYGGTGQVAANCLFIPLPAGSDGNRFRFEVSQHWLPALDQFKPELIIISAGFDAHIEDELAHLRLVEADYGWITGELKALAKRHAQGRIVSCLEGGYALSALGRSVVAHLKALHD